uniref:ATP-binding protein n=1 Tax=Klebsiella pneumoniae TaxID=573 RepID=UPI0013D4C759
GLGLPIAKNLIDMHGGTFTLKSKLRIGTEVTVTLPPERVMSALAPVHETAPSLQPDWQTDITHEKHRARHAPIMNAGTGLKE